MKCLNNSINRTNKICSIPTDYEHMGCINALRLSLTNLHEYIQDEFVEFLCKLFFYVISISRKTMQ